MTSDPSAIHKTAAGGYSKNADTYAKGRPDYPPETDAWLRGHLGLRPGAIVVDLGAGTGKFTPKLVDTGATVIAVEPVAEMLAKISAKLPTVKTLIGTSTAIPLDDASVDVVLCAQSFHWFANAQSLAEIHRVLKPGGRLALIWNMKDPGYEWIKRLDAIVNALEGDTPRYYTGAWRSAFPNPNFTPLQEQHFKHGHTGAPIDVIFNRVRSSSFITVLPADVRANVDKQLELLIRSEPALAGKDEVTVPYVTDAFSALKIG
jgi:SAM-dependent methyltransferase